MFWIIITSFVGTSVPILSYASIAFSMARESKSKKPLEIAAYTSPLINQVLAFCLCFSISIAASISPFAKISKSLISFKSVLSAALSKDDFAFPGFPLN